jgi:hypothetical protein
MVKFILRGIAVISWLVAFLWYIKSPSYDPLLAVLGGLSTFLTSFFVSDANLPSFNYRLEEERNRRAMLTLIKSYWVTPIHEQPLLNLVPFELRLKENLKLIDRPFDSLIGKVSTERFLPLHSKVLEIFERTGKGLLLLGGPGAGKSTLMLKLVRDIVALEEKDSSFQIPVVLSLSTWDGRQKPLVNWLVEELKLRYSVPMKIGRTWLKNQSLMVFLDGLDEIPENNRITCLKVINDFRQEYGLTPMVVCCRKDEYLQSNILLKLHYVLEIQPLTQLQIDRQLKKCGPKMSSIRTLLKHDSSLREIIQSPLMLEILVAAFQGKTPRMLSVPSGTTKDLRNLIFDNYVRRMFERCRHTQKYSPKQIKFWLSYLARQMEEHKISIFTIDTIQPTWLTDRIQRLLYALLCKGFLGLSSCVLGTTIFWLLLICPFITYASIIWGIPWFFGVLFTSISYISFTIIIGLIGMLTGLITGLIGHSRIEEEKISYIEAVSWSWGLAFDEMKKRFESWSHQLSSPGALNDFPVAHYRLLLLLVSSLSVGFHSTAMEEKLDTRRNLNQSAKNGLVAGILGFIYGLIYTTTVWLILTFWGLVKSIVINSGETKSWFIALTILAVVPGIVFGLRAFYRYGGLSIVQNYTLRLIMRATRYIPWNYSSFLNHAADLVFLRRAGGGYMFIHRLMQEYFAEQ